VKWCSPSVVVCPGPYNGDYYNTGGCLVGLAPVGKDAWEPFKATFTATGVSTVTVYINQESTTFSSVVAELKVEKLIAQPSYSFPCGSLEWGAHNAIIKCSTFGGKADAIEVADAGGWTHAYQQFAVDQGDVYRVSGEFYALAIGECDGSAAVKWCSPSVVVCPGPYNGDYYNTGGCYGGVASVGNYSWEPFSFYFSPTGGQATVYINQESTTFSSVVRNLVVEVVTEYIFRCTPSQWSVHNAVVSCSTFGGKADAIEVADAGGWTHAYQQFAVLPDAQYVLTGEFYALAIGECDGSAAVKWCSPSVVVCPGPYNGDYYNTGGCLVGLAPNGKDAWEPFKATFTATGSTATVYINQESTTYSSVVDSLRIKLVKECLFDRSMRRLHHCSQTGYGWDMVGRGCPCSGRVARGS
jgi:hypothetical protein